MEWQEVFREFEGHDFTARYYECDASITLEEIYQAFKARLLDETIPTTGESE
jgi:hypothetical protein